MKTLIGTFARNENFGSKTVSNSNFFLGFILFKEALNCHPWNFYGVILQKKFFGSEFCNRVWIYKKTHFFLKTWCVVKMLIQHLTRCKNFHQQNDDLWKRWLEHSLVMKTLVQKLFSILVFFSDIHSLWGSLKLPSLRFLPCNFAKKTFKSEFCNRIRFYKGTILLGNLMCCKNVDSTSDTLWKFYSKTDDLWKRWLEHSLVMKTLVQKLFSILVFFLTFILFKEALNCHLWGFYCVILQKKFQKRVLQERLILWKHNSTWKLDAL